MRPSFSKSLAWILIVWGLFNMLLPFWREVQVASVEGRFVDLGSGAHVPLGLTAVLAGLAIRDLVSRIAELERTGSAAESRGL